VRENKLVGNSGCYVKGNCVINTASMHGFVITVVFTPYGGLWH